MEKWWQSEKQGEESLFSEISGIAYIFILFQNDLQKNVFSLSELSNLPIKYKRASKSEAATFSSS